MNRIRTHTKTKNQPTKTYTQRKWNCKESCNAIIFIQYFNVFVFAITFTKQLLYLSLKQKTNKKTTTRNNQKKIKIFFHG